MSRSTAAGLLCAVTPPHYPQSSPRTRPTSRVSSSGDAGRGKRPTTERWHRCGLPPNRVTLACDRSIEDRGACARQGFFRDAVQRADRRTSRNGIFHPARRARPEEDVAGVANVTRELTRVTGRYNGDLMPVA